MNVDELDSTSYSTGAAAPATLRQRHTNGDGNENSSEEDADLPTTFESSDDHTGDDGGGGGSSQANGTSSSAPFLADGSRPVHRAARVRRGKRKPWHKICQRAAEKRVKASRQKWARRCRAVRAYDSQAALDLFAWMNTVDMESGGRKNWHLKALDLWHRYYTFGIALLFVVFVGAGFLWFYDVPEPPGLERLIKQRRFHPVDDSMRFDLESSEMFRKSACVPLADAEIAAGKLVTGHELSDIWDAMRKLLHAPHATTVGIVGAHFKINKCLLMMRVARGVSENPNDTGLAGDSLIRMINPKTIDVTTAGIAVRESSHFCPELGYIMVERPKGISISYLSYATGGADRGAPRGHVHPEQAVFELRDAVTASSLLDQLGGFSVCDMKADDGADADGVPQ